MDLYDPVPMDSDSVDWTAQDWDDLVPRLTLLAVLRMARAAMDDGQHGVALAIADAEDIVSRAIAETMSGQHPWDQDGDTLYAHLARAVGSGVLAKAGLMTASHDGDDPGGEWRSDRRQLLDHLYDKSDKFGEMASLMLLENVHQTAELATALEVVPVEIGNLRRRMKREVRDYIAAHGS